MIDIQVINALLDSFFKSLYVMAGIEAIPGEAKAKKDNFSLGEVSGIMEMSNKETKGSMALTFSKPFVIDLVQRMLGDKITDVNETARDLTGELTNMITGGAKRILSEKGLEIGMSSPSIFSGVKHEIEHSYNGDTILIPFKTDFGDIFLEVNFVR